jgi:hypothetical protein
MYEVVRLSAQSRGSLYRRKRSLKKIQSLSQFFEEHQIIILAKYPQFSGYGPGVEDVTLEP